MLPYLFLLFLNLLCIVMYDVHKIRGGASFFYVLICVYAILLSGFSYRIGGDIYNYMNTYDTLPSLKEFKWSECDEYPYQPFYMLLCAISKSLSPDFWVFHLMQSTIVCTVVFRFILKRTHFHFTGALMFLGLFYINFTFGILKESLAVAFVLMGYKYIERKKYAKYLLFVCIAFMFHLSAVVALILPFARNLRFDKTFVLYVFFMLIFLAALYPLSSYIFFYEKIFDKFSQYAEGGSFNINWYIATFIQQTAIPLIMLYLFRHKFNNSLYGWAFCFYALCGLGTVQYNIIFSRPTNYVLPFIAILLADLLGNSYKRALNYRILCVTSFMVFCLISRNYIFLHDDGYRMLYPYSSIFTKEVNPERERWMRNFWRY